MKFSLKVGKRAKWFERRVTESSQTVQRTTGEIWNRYGIVEGRTHLWHKQVCWHMAKMSANVIRLKNIKRLHALPWKTAYIYAMSTLCKMWSQERSRKSATRGMFWESGGLGAKPPAAGGMRVWEPPALENFAFFCKNNFILGQFWLKNNTF